MRDLGCPRCGQRLAFENSVFLSCDRHLGFSLEHMAILVLGSAEESRQPGFVDAARYDPDLFGDALEKNIVIVTPSTLLATLRTIHNIWRFEYQNRHAAEIAEKAGRLYDKFVGFVADLEEVGRKLAATQKSYDDARKKLVSGRGNLVKSAEDIKALGAKASKSLPADLVETAPEQALPRELAGAEE